MISKVELRKRALQARIALPEARRQAANAAIASALQGWEPYRQARHVCLYASFGSEVDTLSLLEHFEAGSACGAGDCGAGDGVAAGAGRVLCLPRVFREELELLRVLPFANASGSGVLERLERSPLGMPEPAVGLPLVAPALVDIIVIPGSAFSVQGHRLGYGKGYYDRLLAQAPRAIKVGLAFDVQVFPAEGFPQEAHDVPLDWLVTESGIRHVAACR